MHGHVYVRILHSGEDNAMGLLFCSASSSTSRGLSFLQLIIVLVNIGMDASSSASGLCFYLIFKLKKTDLEKLLLSLVLDITLGFSKL